MATSLTNLTASDDAYTCPGCDEVFEPASDAEAGADGLCYLCRAGRAAYAAETAASIDAVPAVRAVETCEPETRPDTFDAGYERGKSEWRANWETANERAAELQRELDARPIAERQKSAPPIILAVRDTCARLNVRPSSRLVALALVTYANKVRTTRVSLGTLAAQTGQSTNTVRAALRDLQARGIIEKVANGAPGRATHFRFSNSVRCNG